jgi:hypothetical protein
MMIFTDTTICMFLPRRMRWTGHAVGIKILAMHTKLLSGNLTERGPLEYLGLDNRIRIKKY